LEKVRREGQMKVLVTAWQAGRWSCVRTAKEVWSEDRVKRWSGLQRMA
jgi:hypothetical protein